jgi:3-dehydroquinate synthetase
MENILQSMRYDKKMNAGMIRFALPVKIGEVRAGVEVENLEAVFEEV